MNSTLTVNFYNQDYDWDVMETDVDATSELMYHCAVAVNTVPWTDSLAYSSLYGIQSALQNYFGFNTGNVEDYDSYTATEWRNLLKNEIDAGRPVFYSAQSSTSYGHTWIVDGYDSHNKFHCNWGWANQNDENDVFYELSNLNPLSFNFNQDHKALTGVYPILDACSGLDGADVVCSSNESYSVSIPSSASVLWSKSASLNQVGGNTDPTYTVNAATSGTTGYVTATIKNSQNRTVLTRTKNVWVGDPITPEITGNPFVDCTYSLFTDANMQSVTWSVYGPLQIVGPNQGYKCTVQGTGTGMGWVYATASNDCNPSVRDEFMVQVSCGLMLVFTPNPTNRETIVSIETDSQETTFDETAPWELEVYSETQLLKTKQPNLRGRSAKIQTAGWQEGVYIVRVNYNDEILTGKLVVKR